jgi:hypothetical protein
MKRICCFVLDSMTNLIFRSQELSMPVVNPNEMRIKKLLD